MEFQPVIEALVGQGADALHRPRGHARLQLDQDAALGRIDDQQILGGDRAPVRGGGLGDGRRGGKQGKGQGGGGGDLQSGVYPLTLARTASAMAGLTKLSIAPSRRAISLTRREAIA